MFERVKPYLERSDLTIANSESIIGGQELGLSSYPAFNSPYEVGDILKDVGVMLSQWQITIH
ncbi:Poly-gamma-glutamate synthesis protein (Capsule biosynthesis protein) OS=Ureibacillus acetophenoni OX=614649 GN=SAMN05877842_103146 PE=3 SV=1 [Ureibacillus acetophenoni]